MVTINDLCFSYIDKEVSKNITFNVDKGDFFAILGPNAAGKTTLLKVMTGLLRKQNGSIFIAGKDMSNGLSNDIKVKIGTMHSIDGLYLKMTGFEYLSFVAALYDYPPEKIKNRVLELSKLYKMETEIHKQIKKCSAGTQKKISFCAALVYEPEILFLDEPFESVDPSATYIMKQKLNEFKANGGTIVITSHILESIQNLCNKYLIINHGKIVDEGLLDKSSIDLEKRFMEVVDDDSTGQETI